ncbi:hypothetical protein [uncultured Dysosmobacter sp.]|uniref:GntT/GntP/DsdX family permease n=1 Tax=uncultured Dysosmobacter sp. TaxID=2591384 RepID=UPI002630F9FF|nr:hypothetical protein [uncultured Dysosmobacter sp.]
MEIVSIIGMIAALALLSFLVMKGVNIFIAAIASSLLVAITGQIGLYDALQTNYMGGFTGFFGGNFLIFVAGALMGQVYEKTNGAKAIARLIIKGLGKGAAIIAVPLAIGILTYGGIAGFVVCLPCSPSLWRSTVRLTSPEDSSPASSCSPAAPSPPSAPAIPRWATWCCRTRWAPL